MTGLAEIAERLQRLRRAYVAAHGRALPELRFPAGGPPPEFSIWTAPQELSVLVLADGILLMSEQEPASERWYVSGGPAIKVDMIHTRTPLQVRVILGMRGGARRPQGIARAIAEEELPVAVWRGNFGAAMETAVVEFGAKRKLNLARHELNLREALRRATFGFYGDVMGNVPEPTAAPRELIRNLGFFPADLNNRRFFHRLAIAAAPDGARWTEAAMQSWAAQALRSDLAKAAVQPLCTPADSIAQTADAGIWSRRLAEHCAALDRAVRESEHIAELEQVDCARTAKNPSGIEHDALGRLQALLPQQGSAGGCAEAGHAASGPAPRQLIVQAREYRALLAKLTAEMD